MTEYLTEYEHQLIRRLGELWNDLNVMVGHGPSRSNDLAELVVHVHAIQQAIMSQAAARAYPGEYRLLGETLERTP